LGSISVLSLTSDKFSEFELNFALMSRVSDIFNLFEALRGVTSVWLAISDCKGEHELQHPMTHLVGFLSNTDSFSLSFLKRPTNAPRGAWSGYAEDPAVWLKDSRLASLLHPPKNLFQLALPIELALSLLPFCGASLEILIIFGTPGMRVYQLQIL
jgi:hypothetical protein